MGGYQLADVLAQSRDGWIMALVVGYMAGATIIFSIPVGLAMLAKRDHKYMALGIMSGVLSIPVGVFITCALLAFSGLSVRPDIATSGDATHQIGLTLGVILTNLLPLIIFCVAIALGLRFIPDAMIKGFLWFGKIMNAGITLVLAFSIVEYFTGIFTTVFGAWGFRSHHRRRRRPVPRARDRRLYRHHAGRRLPDGLPDHQVPGRADGGAWARASACSRRVPPGSWRRWQTSSPCSGWSAPCVRRTRCSPSPSPSARPSCSATTLPSRRTSSRR